MKDLSGARILVIGGSGGIGRAFAARAVQDGADVTLASRSAERLARAKVETGAAKVLSCDARRPEEVKALFEGEPQFDHVLLSAAELEAGPLRSQTSAQIEDALCSKFMGAVNVGRFCHISPGGSLTFVSGMLGVRPSGKATVLSAINAGLDALAQALALELAPLRVNCVSPGRVDSSWWDRTPHDTKERIFQETARRLPVGRIGTAEEIAQMIYAVTLNPFMTGAVIQVDGGNQLV